MIDDYLKFPDIPSDCTSGVLDALLESQIAYGSSRSVRGIIHDKNKVVKIDFSDSMYQNFIEYALWCDFSETEEAKNWLAKCYNISTNGRVIVQEKLKIFNDKNDARLPDKIPRFLTDTKVSNWGVDNNGNVKCCDYGNILIMQSDPWKLKKAKWREE